MWKQIWRDTIHNSRIVASPDTFYKLPAHYQTHTPLANKLRGTLSAPQRPLSAIRRVGREEKKGLGGASFCHNSLTIFFFFQIEILFLVLTRDTGHAKEEDTLSLVRTTIFYLIYLI